MRQAIQRLRDGGIVAVGMDWPHPEETLLTNIFGKPAYIPLGTARLALLGNAVTIVISFYGDEQGHTHVLYSDPIEVIRTGNKDEDIRLNTAAYFQVAEEFLLRHPDQWLMYQLVWAPQPETTPSHQPAEEYSKLNFRKESTS